ncbi:MAG: mechanosensitive ion channel domain-containing protein [Syntrophobacteraceae bacterium]
MRKRPCHQFCALGLLILLGLSQVTRLEAQEGSVQFSPKAKPSAINPDKLPDILAEGAAKLEGHITALAQQEESSRQTAGPISKELENLQARTAALNASMAVNGLSLAEARETLEHLSKDEKNIVTRAKGITQDRESLGQKIQEHSDALTAVEEQVAELVKTRHPVYSLNGLQEAYRKYRQLAEQYVKHARAYQENLGKSIEKLGAASNLIRETKSKLETEYLEKALKQELLERQDLKHRLRQARQVLVAFVTLPGKTYAWLVQLSRSGDFFSFVENNWTNLFGLFLFLVLLGMGARRFQRLVLPHLAISNGRETEVGLRVFLTFLQILAAQLFSIGFVVWLYVAFWSLGIISNVAAWLIWSGAVTLVALRVTLTLVQHCFAGSETGGLLALTEAPARFYRRHLRILLSFFFLMRFFVMLNARHLGLTAENAQNLGTLLQVMLLGWVLWLLRSRHLEEVLTALSAPVLLRRKAFQRALWSTLSLILAFVVVSGLLGFKFLSEYVAQGTCLTMIILALAWILGEIAHAIVRLTLHPETGAVAHRISEQKLLLSKTYRALTRVLACALFGAAMLITLSAWGITAEHWVWAFKWLNWGFSVGPVRLTPLNIGLTVLVLYLGWWLSRAFRNFLEVKYFPSKGWDTGIQYTVSMTTHYVMLVVTALIAMNTLGMSFANLALMAGGLGVGIGFGLQNIVSNFLSGLILLFERPIKVGDMLVIDGQWGMVKEIRVRSTIFQTFDRYFLIIPNSELISGKILNWTYSGWGINRLTLKVGVSYGSDPRIVTRLIEEACQANPRVVKDPPPQIYFEAYGDSALNFNIWVHLATPGDRIPATHELNSAIFEVFQKHGIEIPFPQRDVRVRSLGARNGQGHVLG